MAAVPSTTDALTDLPHFLGGRDCDDVADDLVSRDTGVLDREVSEGNLLVTGENSTMSTEASRGPGVVKLTCRKRRTREP